MVVRHAEPSLLSPTAPISSIHFAATDIKNRTKGKGKGGGKRARKCYSYNSALSPPRHRLLVPLPCFPLFCLTLTYQHGSDIASIGRHSSTSRSFLRSHIDDAGCCDMGLYHQYWTRTSLHLWAKIGCSPSPWTNTILVCVDVCMQFTTCWRYANSPIIVFFLFWQPLCQQTNGHSPPCYHQDTHDGKDRPLHAKLSFQFSTVCPHHCCR